MHPDYRRGRAWTMAALLSLFMFVNFIDKIAIGLAAVPLMEEFKLTPSQFGVLASSFFWLFSMASVLGGFLANRFSAKWLLIGMALLWSLAQLPILLASSATAIVAARVLLGIGEGPAAAIAVHAAYKWFPDEKRSLPVAVIFMGGTLGLIVAGLAVPHITRHWGWRANFAILFAVGLGWALLWAAFGSEGPLDQAAATDTPGRAHPRVSYLRLLTDASVASYLVLHFVAYWSLALMLTWLPVYLQKGLGLEPVSAGRMFGLIVLLSIPINIVGTWGSQRLQANGSSDRASRVLVTTFAVTVAGTLFIALELFPMTPMTKVALLCLAAGLPSIVYSLGPAMLAQIVPPAQRAALLGIDNGIATTAAILAPAIMGRLVESSTGAIASGYEQGFALSGALLLAGAVLAWLFIHPERSASRLGEQPGRSEGSPAPRASSY